MADAPWPDFSQHMAEGDNIVQRRIDQFNIAAEQRIDQFNAAAEQGVGLVNKNAEERIVQINNTLQQTVKKFDTVAEEKIGTIYAKIANFVAILEKILSTALFIFKVGMLFMLILFLYGD